MPIFEFVCSQCGNEFEKLVLGSNRKVLCPECSSTDVEKKMSVCAFKTGSNFVGTGKKAANSCSGCTSTKCSSCGS
ncbi:MAG TPA: zinc ribbon domain-containing protein [Thermodesulfobacteriaceae bacterium]|nr:zinc ribbon domain-containing protein [Thermodesulfobacteriaceae bacterium]